MLLAFTNDQMNLVKLEFSGLELDRLATSSSYVPPQVEYIILNHVYILNEVLLYYYVYDLVYIWNLE